MSDQDVDEDIIELWIASNVFGREGLESELGNLSTIRLSKGMVDLGVAISRGKPPRLLLDRLAEIAGIEPGTLPFDELLDEAIRTTQGL